MPAYLQQQGYEIIPVNPNIEEALGVRAYPDLSSVPGPVDIVAVYRRSESVPEIAAEAIAIEARVLWLQEGIINLEAAAAAQDAGLQVVMNACTRLTHQRLLGEP